MRHVMFWLFQGAVLLGAVTALYVTIATLREPAIAFESKTGEVLSSADVAFYQSSESSPDPDQLYKIINDERREYNLSALVASRDLAEVARSRAVDMAEAEYYAHENPVSGQTFADDMQQRSLEYQYACENLNMAFSSREVLTVKAWLESSAGHRECMLRHNLTHVGYATAEIELDDNKKSYIIVAIHANM